jgi:hypothetical protein
VPDWVREALPRLPELMATADRRASAAERGAVDLAEAVLLAGRAGEEFDAVVIAVNGSRPRRGRASGGKVNDDGKVNSHVLVDVRRVRSPG